MIDTDALKDRPKSIIVQSQREAILTVPFDIGFLALESLNHEEGFGTEVLTKVLGYEFKAETRIAFENDGLRCSMRLPFSERVGRLAEA